MSEQAQPRQYGQVVRAIRDTAWAILPSTLAAILEFVEIRLSGGALTDEEIQARIGGRAPRRAAQMAGDVAVLPLYGVITHRADLFTDISGGTSVQRFRNDFLDAVGDKSVAGIVIDIDSPGGSVDGLTELAADIRASRGPKPIVAVANTLAASAAYWLGSQADEFVVTPSAMAGSIGVIAAHDDISKLQEQLGVKTTLISAGRYKTEGNPFEPLSDEARAAIQQLVDETYGTFVADVAKGRRASVETVRAEFGQGRLLKAKAAVEQGMADRVDTLDGAVAAVTRAARATGSAQQTGAEAPNWNTEAGESGLTFAEQAEGARRASLELVGSARSFARLTGVKRDQFAAIEAAHREVADTIAALLTEPQPEEGLDASADAELAWTLARLPV